MSADSMEVGLCCPVADTEALRDLAYATRVILPTFRTAHAHACGSSVHTTSRSYDLAFMCYLQLPHALQRCHVFPGHTHLQLHALDPRLLARRTVRHRHCVARLLGPPARICIGTSLSSKPIACTSSRTGVRLGGTSARCGHGPDGTGGKEGARADSMDGRLEVQTGKAGVGVFACRECGVEVAVGSCVPQGKGHGC